MKQLTFLSKFFFLALAISFMSSCGEDGTDKVTLPPVIELQTGADLITSATTLDAGAVFNVRIIADKGDNDMTSFTVLEDGIAIDASRLNYNNAGAGALSNPYTLSSGEATTFDTNIEITAHDSGTRNYTFRITDSANETDDTSVEISITTTPMAIGFGNGGITADATINDAGWFPIQIIASKGGSPLSTIAVLEDNVDVDAARVRFNTIDDFSGAVDFSTNPFDLVNDEKTGIDWFLWVNSHDMGTKTYTFKVAAENGDTEEVSLAISIFMGTAVSELTAKLLLNSDGPAGQGGINLLSGDGNINSTSTEAHLKDQGIDLNLPPATNWIRKIAPVNGSVLRTPAGDFGAYADIQFSEEIELGFQNGTTISETSEVVIGDQFLVQAATGEYILVLVTNITETTDNNADSYELSIKR